MPSASSGRAPAQGQEQYQAAREVHLCDGFLQMARLPAQPLAAADVRGHGSNDGSVSGRLRNSNNNSSNSSSNGRGGKVSSAVSAPANVAASAAGGVNGPAFASHRLLLKTVTAATLDSAYKSSATGSAATWVASLLPGFCSSFVLLQDEDVEQRHLNIGLDVGFMVVELDDSRCRLTVVIRQDVVIDENEGWMSPLVGVVVTMASSETVYYPPCLSRRYCSRSGVQANAMPFVQLVLSDNHRVQSLVQEVEVIYEPIRRSVDFLVQRGS